MKSSQLLILLLLLSYKAFALEIQSQVSGDINYLKTIGDQVSKGDVVVSIDNRQATLKLKHLEVIGKIKQQAYDDAKLKFEQTKELYDRMVSSHRDLDLSRIEFEAKERELNAHNIKIEIQKIELEKYQLKSPISGVIKAIPNMRNTNNSNTDRALMIIE